MRINVTDKKPESIKSDLYVVAVSDDGEPGAAASELSAEVRKAVSARAKAVSFKAKKGVSLSVQTSAGDVLVVGIGESADAESLRRAASKAQQAAEGIKAGVVTLCVGSRKDGLRWVTPLLEGFLLSTYRFDKYQTASEDRYEGPKTLNIAGSRIEDLAAAKADVEHAKTVTDAVCLARDLVNEMSKVKTPSFLVRTAKGIARGTTLKCEVWQGDRLKRENMNGILAVSAGSDEPGAFIRMIYKPARRSKGKIAIVGKGITFDSGGLSLKPSKFMEWMKQDMAGAAAVLAVMKAVVALAPDVEVRGYIATAENMTGGCAQKPGDIITYRNGTTAEVLNTDAEGRLVLADALCVASEDKPDCIIDLATLTGACIVALGDRIAGVMGNDQELVDAVIEHGKRSGENFWQLPLFEEYEDHIRSWNADIQNIGAGSAGTITAALFLQHFVGEDLKWAHLDIAGPGFAEKPHPYSAKGGTGFGIRTLLSYLESF
ncbi:MAG: leucyl aminopeptidase [Candidatus Binatia bacterium]